jgi:branched-chain amino acid aminotransferase
MLKMFRSRMQHVHVLLSRGTSMMQSTTSIWQNGKLIPWEEAKIHVLSHSLHYGGSAFEGIRFYQTVEGPAIFRVAEHVERLLYSCKALKIVLPYSKEEIIVAIKTVISASHLEEGYIRPIAFYGYAKLGVNPTGNPCELVIACWPWGAYLAHTHVDIKTSSYIRIHPDSTVVDAKICGHYVNSILACLELQGTHYHEALLLDSKGHIAEGVAENFFMVKQGVLYTPRLGSILSGITRDTVIELAKHMGLTVIETDLVLEQAYSADEAFFTGTAAEITAIRSIDDKLIGQGEIGALTQQLKHAYLEVVHGRHTDFKKYLNYVENLSLGCSNLAVDALSSVVNT